MGFFDNLLKKGANRVLSNLVNDAADKLTDKIEDIENDEFEELSVEGDESYE